jgi:dTDP-4-amino-4,6-dideoxygalactose transaminase
MKIPLAKPYFPSGTLESVKEVLDSGWVTQGPKVKKLEDKYTEYNGSKHAIAVSSGTAALHVSLLALGIGKDDEVIVPDFTFPATGNTVLFTGAKPVISDIDLKTYCIDPKEVKRNITPKTKAIIPVHCFGHPAQMTEIMEIAHENNLFVIEDAAPAHGAELQDKKVGNFGICGCFSFHPRKIITTGEGGMITTNDHDMADKARQIRNHGMKYERNVTDNVFNLPSFNILGNNYRMSDILAAIGIEQLKILDKSIEERRRLAELYNDLIQENNIDVVTPIERENIRHVYQSYVIQVRKEDYRNTLIKGLISKGVESTIGTYSLSNLPLYQYECKNGTKAFNNTLALPMYERLKDKDVKYIVDCLKKRY